MLHVPAGYEGAGPLPLVLALHGAGASARWMLAETGWAEKANTAGFFTAFPEATPTDPSRPGHFRTNPLFWNEGDGRPPVDDVAFIRALVEHLGSRYAVDRRRIYVTGFSNGATFTFRLANDLSTRLAAVAPVAGYCLVPDPQPERAVPTLYIVGTTDPLIPLAGGEVRTPWGETLRRPAVEDSLARWAKVLGCPPQPAGPPAEGGIQRIIYGPGRDGVELSAYLVEGLGHHWPGGAGRLAGPAWGPPSEKIRGTDTIWEFFQDRSLSADAS